MASDPHQPLRRDRPVDSPLPAWQGVVQPRASSPEIASVPRRYGPGTLMVVTAAYALLFSGFKALGADQAWWVGTAMFLTGIGIAQMIGGPKNARPASMIAGAIMLPISSIAAGLMLGLKADSSFVVGLVCSVLFGVPLGYVGGVLVGGVFLMMRYADAAIGRWKQRAPEEEPVEADVVDER